MTESLISPKSELARKGETLACDHLIRKGYVIIQRNYRIGQGELDIIARISITVKGSERNELVFVEVKTRESAFLTDPLQLVPLTKQRQVIRLASTYLKTLKTMERARFDIVIVVHNAQYTRIEHIEDAFYPM
ncbi:MAG: YraN family protein [Bacteroidota bacterium]